MQNFHQQWKKLLQQNKLTLSVLQNVKEANRLVRLFFYVAWALKITGVTYETGNTCSSI